MLSAKRSACRSRKPALSEAEGDPFHHGFTIGPQGVPITAPRNPTFLNYKNYKFPGTLSLATSDRALSFPRTSTAETE